MFDRPRRRRRLRSSGRPSTTPGVAGQEQASQEPWVALALEELTQGAKGPQDAVEPPRSKPNPPPPTAYPLWAVLPTALLVGVAVVFVCQSAIRTTLSQSWIGNPSLSSLERATAISSNNSLGWYRLGLKQANEGAAGAAQRSFRMAADLAPSDSATRIALGLEFERAGQFHEAERTLLDGSVVDAGFGVRWSLANYYLRRGDWDEYWLWLRDAIQADPTQLPLAASLSWRANADPATILDRGIPDQPDTNRGYFAYLYDLGQLDAMRQAWPRYSAVLTRTETPLAAQFINRLIDAGFVEEAVDAWNLLCDNILLPHAPLGPEEQRFLTNPYFLTAPSGLGFDWRAQEYRGVAWSRLPIARGRSGVEFRLAGTQESGLTLLSQVIPTVPGEYTLKFEFATQGMPTRTGVGWVVKDPYTGETLRAFEGLHNAEGFWDSGDLTYTAPVGTRAVVLELYYEAAEVGVLRRGGVLLRNVELSKTDSDGAVAL